MIDQSHNIKPKTEAMIQTVMSAQELFTKAMLVDHAAALAARDQNDIILAESALRDAFATDVRPFLAAYRIARRLPPNPLEAFRQSGYLTRAAADRGPRKPRAGGSYA
jgi:L-rhamnose isomerase/sugar isomerase